MTRLTRQQAIGLCLLLLISSNEGVHVSNQISLMKSVQHVNETVAAIQEHVAKESAALQENDAANEHARVDARWITRLFSNFESSVCPPDMNVGDIAKRFAYKSEKLQEAGRSLFSRGLVVGAGVGNLRELVGRAKGLGACTAAAEARPEKEQKILKDLVENKESGVQAQLMQVYNMMITTVNKSSLTSWKPDSTIHCTMDLKFEVSGKHGDDVVTDFQKTFYGESCDVAAYKDKQPDTSRRILERLEEKLKMVIAEMDGGKSPDDVLEELVSGAEQSNDDGVDSLASLLELGDSLEAGVGFILELIVAVLAFICIAIGVVACMGA